MDLCLSLTHACNLGCGYCYAGAKRQAAMTRETAEAAIDIALGRRPDSMQLGFFGGEPLLEWDLLRYATQTTEEKCAAASAKLKKTVTTNATLLTSDRVDWLLEHDFYPALSIDGNRAMHDATRRFCNGRSSFDACMRGLDAALERFPDVEVIAVPDPANVRHLIDGVRFLADEKGVRRVSVNPNFYADWPEDALLQWRAAYTALADFAIERYRAHRPLALNVIDAKVITRLKNGFECRDRCNFGEREIAVAPSGRIYPCERLIGADQDHSMCIGTVFDGFDEDRRTEILSRRGNVNAECLSCGIRSRCMNWCCCINYTLTGAIDVTDGIVCFHERAAVAEADRVGATLFEERNPEFLARFYYEDFAPLQP